MAETSLHHFRQQPSYSRMDQRGPWLFLSVWLTPSAVGVSQPLHISTFITSPILQQVDREELCTKSQKTRVPQPPPSRASIPLKTYWHIPQCAPRDTGNCGTTPSSELGLRSKHLCASMGEGVKAISNWSPPPQEEKALAMSTEHKFFAGPRRVTESSKFWETLEILSFKADSRF